ncbi:MAG: FixH family protein [Pseudomonadota bacterium]
MSLLTSLAAGVVLIAGVFFLVRHLLPGREKQIALIVGILSLAVYAPYAILNWRGADEFTMHVVIFLLTAYVLGLIFARRLDGEARRFHWGPAIIIAFFSVIVVMNAIFVTVATKGLQGAASEALLPEPKSGTSVSSFFPGTVSHDYHKKEALFNDYLDRVERQSERGWHVSKGWMSDPVAGEAVVLRLTGRDKGDTPLAGGQVRVDFLRPSDKRLDFSTTLKEVEPGIYEAPVTLARSGLWLVVMRLQIGNEVHEIRARTDVLAPASEHGG